MKVARKRKTIYQMETLMKRFQENPWLDEQELLQLAGSLNISEEKIKAWYANSHALRRKAEELPMGEEHSS